MSPCGRRKVPDTSPPASVRTAIKPATTVTAVTATRRNLTTERIGVSAAAHIDAPIFRRRFPAVARGEDGGAAIALMTSAR